MINGQKILAIIPARGGSKGLPGKNIKNLAGKPLIAWTIEETQKSLYIDRTILSSEDEEIIAIAKEWGCEVPFRRPRRLAQDNTPGIAPVLDVIRRIPGYDYVVLLQPTSPLRKTSDIDHCIRQCIEGKANSLVSVTPSPKSPYWMFSRQGKNGAKRLKPVLPWRKKNAMRQELPSTFVLNGAVYVAQCRWLLKTESFLDKTTLSYVMPAERSVDIDSPIDFNLAETMIQK